MSITNLIDKIKSNNPIDKNTILFLFIIIGVGISSFSLGRLSINSDLGKDLEISASSLSQRNTPDTILEQNNQKTIDAAKEKRYVASKNGKMYYPIGCSAAKRIKPENEIWFSSETEAEKSGYIKSSMCK